MNGTEPVRVALLLPLSASAKGIREVAKSLQQAAELALFDQGNNTILLVPKDTGGTASGAALAAQEAINQGAELILGPLFASSVQAVAPIARQYDVSVVAFSTDSNVAGNGVYLLSFMPENEVDAVTRYAADKGLRSFAALYPYGAYGDRVSTAFNQSIMKYGGLMMQSEYYDREPSAMFEPVKRLTDYNGRIAALEMEKRRLREQGDEASMAALKRLEDSQAWGGVDFEAVLLPEEGNLLRSLAPLLPYYDVDPRQVKFLGTGLWDNPEIMREPSLVGGWFAAPSPESREVFAVSYEQTFGAKPPRIASLAYDGVMLAATLSDNPRGQRFRQPDITNPNGFFGIDGLFRFFPDGRNERGLSIIEVTSTGFEVIQPAPQSFMSESGS